jgi:hypothetical protein
MQVYSHRRFQVENKVLVHTLISMEGQVEVPLGHHDLSADLTPEVFAVAHHHLVTVPVRVLVAMEVVISLQGWMVG